MNKILNLQCISNFNGLMVRDEKSSSYPVQHLQHVCFTLLVSCTRGITSLVLLLVAGCFLRSGCNKREEIVHFSIGVCGTPSVQVVKFPLSRDQLLQSCFIRMQMRTIGLARQTDLWTCGRGEKIKRMVSICSLFITNKSEK